MGKITHDEIKDYIQEHISSFHKQRIACLSILQLSAVLKKKNPYLFKAKNVLTSQDIVKGIVDAHISSNEETIFGDFLEGLAIFICSKTYGGWKSSAHGIDLEFDKDGKRYLVSIKSGPNWGNKSQIDKLIADFNTAKKTLGTGNSNLQVITVNGCCYGRDNKPLKAAGYFKYCGQRFWEFISGDSELYLKIIEPLGHQTKQKNEEYLQLYSQMLNRFTLEFSTQFCLDNGKIDWDKLIRFNSAISK